MLKMALLFTLAMIVISGACQLAGAQENTVTVHGTVYYWYTLEPLKNAIVEVNTVPSQTQVATDGKYSFELLPGDYTITASYYKGDFLFYYAEENLTILETGADYVVDLLAFPPFDYDEMDDDLVPIFDTDSTDNTWLFVAVILAVGATVAVIFYYLKARSKKKSEVKIDATPSTIKVISLPQDLEEVIAKIRKAGGRINQLELRKQLPQSESKVSYMLADLESRGVLRKVKKGRGNIIILNE